MSNINISLDSIRDGIFDGLHSGELEYSEFIDFVRDVLHENDDEERLYLKELNSMTELWLKEGT